MSLNDIRAAHTVLTGLMRAGEFDKSNWWHLRWIPSVTGRRYRVLGWMYVTPFILLLIMQGRFYYLAPAYPMLIAAGAAVGDRWLDQLPSRWSRFAQRMTGALAVGALIGCALMLPVASINSTLCNVTSQVHDNFVEQVGWQELVATVADTYNLLPAEEKPVAGILF